MDEKRFLTGENWKRMPTTGGLLTDTGDMNEQLFLKYPGLRQANTKFDGPDSELTMSLDYEALGNLLKKHANDPAMMKSIAELIRQKLAEQEAQRSVSQKNKPAIVKTDLGGEVPPEMMNRIPGTLGYIDPFKDSTK
jgi:hypothetical protein